MVASVSVSSDATRQLSSRIWPTIDEQGCKAGVVSEAATHGYSTAFDSASSMVPPVSVNHGQTSEPSGRNGGAAVRLASWLGLAAAATFLAAGVAGAREVVRADTARRRGVTTRDGVPVPGRRSGSGWPQPPTRCWQHRCRWLSSLGSPDPEVYKQCLSSAVEELLDAARAPMLTAQFWNSFLRTTLIHALACGA